MSARPRGAARAAAAATLALALAIASNAAAQAPAPAPAPVKDAPDAKALSHGLARCAAVAEKAARLACFDELAGAAVEQVFSGKGGAVTDVFAIAAPRLLHFQSSDVIMVVYLLDPDGAVLKNLHLGGQGVGEHLIETPGRYRLQINASGAWRIWLTPPPAPQL